MQFRVRTFFWYNIWFSVSDADHATIIRISAPQNLNSAPEGASSRSRSPSCSPEGEAAPRNTHPDPPRPAALRPVPPLPVYHKYQVLAPGGYRTQFLSQSSLLAIKIMAAGRHGGFKMLSCRMVHGGWARPRGSDSVRYARNARPLTPRESQMSTYISVHEHACRHAYSSTPYWLLWQHLLVMSNDTQKFRTGRSRTRCVQSGTLCRHEAALRSAWNLDCS